jgi:hypothetical protein
MNLPSSPTINELRMTNEGLAFELGYRDSITSPCQSSENHHQKCCRHTLIFFEYSAVTPAATPCEFFTT